MEETKQYVVVTTIQTFRHRYVIPVSECLDTAGAKDSVTLEEVKEFSQEWLGETIVDTRQETLKGAIQLLDEDCAYLSGWATEQKTAYIDNWKEPKDNV